MPRFSKEERRALIGAAEAFLDAKDPEIRAGIRSALRKLKASDEHHAKREAEGRKS